MAVIAIGGVCQAAADDSWVNDPPKDSQFAYAMPELDASQFTEIPISLADTAFEILKTAPVVEVGERYFPGFKVPCPLPKKAYLVRAVYEHGSNGNFHVKQLRNALWILHYALGAASTRHRSALVVCTKIEPTIIYVSAGGAM